MTQAEQVESNGLACRALRISQNSVSKEKADSAKAELTGRRSSAGVAAPVSRKGDLWILGSHRLLCGDARSDSDYARLLGDETADLVLTDPPFNVRVDGNVSGLGKVHHEEFAMASGEMSEAEFTAFLSTFLGHARTHYRDGAILFVFMDWRHLFELTCAGREQGLALKNLIVWAKDNAGMGTFYRSRHELVFVFKNGLVLFIPWRVGAEEIWGGEGCKLWLMASAAPSPMRPRRSQVRGQLGHDPIATAEGAAFTLSVTLTRARIRARIGKRPVLLPRADLDDANRQIAGHHPIVRRKDAHGDT
jgi:DNA methylase